jgi:hypothetical protein
MGSRLLAATAAGLKLVVPARELGEVRQGDHQGRPHVAAHHLAGLLAGRGRALVHPFFFSLLFYF